MKKNLKKSLIVFAGITFILTSIVILSSIYTVSNSYAQEKTAIGKDKIKSILLNQEGWIGELNHGTYGLNLINYVFEDRGKKIIVEIYIPDDKDGCKRKVKITSDGFRMPGCYIGIAELFYDPNDHRYPFKTKAECVNENETPFIKN
jgi:hypothetical protein